MHWFWCASLCLVVVTATVRASEPPSQVGLEVDTFTLPDERGALHGLADLAAKRLVVLAFLGTECPIARLYAGRLQVIAERFEDQGVAVWGIDSNHQDSPEEIAEFRKSHGIRFPVLCDGKQKAADLLGAQRTAEVFVLDGNRVIRYHGAIDDRYDYEIQRFEVKNDYLVAALEDLLAGRPVRAAETKAAGCLIHRAAEPRHASSVTWSNQICRIFQQRCVTCHRPGEAAPFSMLDYREVVGWTDMIDEVVRQGRMPPWHASPRHGRFANDRRLSDEEKQRIHEWIRAGAPEGDAGDLPPAPKFTEGWQLPGRPDLEIAMRDRPETVPSHGTIEYKYYMVDPGFTEDRWVKAAEVKPSNRAVIHHVLVFVLAPGQEETPSGAEGGFLAAYVPGLSAEVFPEGMAKHIPARSKLVFQVHYTPIGSAQQANSTLGMVFASSEEITHQIVTLAAVQTELRIPPHAADYQREAISAAAPMDVVLLAMMPHMHLRGKSFLYEAVYPGGKKEILLDVPRYDFNWQTAYRLAEPKILPSGTRIRCVAHYDNSEHNPANPDPSATVRWGEQTWDEMMIGYFDVAVAIPDGRPIALANSGGTEERVDRALRRFDVNADGLLSQAELPERLRPFFGQFDGDGDGLLARDELTAAMKRLRR